MATINNVVAYISNSFLPLLGYPQPVYRDIQQYIQQQTHQQPPHQHPQHRQPVQPPPVPASVQPPPPPHLATSQPPPQQPQQPQPHPHIPQVPPANIPPGKDRSRPRGRMTPYAFFVQERREHYRRHGVPVEFTAFSKECSLLWKGLNEEDKVRYQKMSEDDKERYRKESASYHASIGQPFRDGGSKRGRKRKEPGQPKRNM